MQSYFDVKIKLLFAEDVILILIPKQISLVNLVLVRFSPHLIV